MYEAHWGLRRAPFENRSACDFFYCSRSHEPALLKLRYVLERGLGGGLLTGESGTGKSFLTAVLAVQTEPEFGPFVHVPFPRMSPVELLGFLAYELSGEDSEFDPAASVDRSLRALLSGIRRFNAEGRHPVCVVDEAHLLDEEVFETLHLLLNFQQRPDCDFSVLVVGDTSSIDAIRRRPQLDERLPVKSLLQRLTAEETAEYVRHRLSVAGNEVSPFDDEGLRTVFELSDGLPRRINRLCELALLVGYAEGSERIGVGQLEAVGEELIAVVPD